jgi:hypothetical protein
MTRIINSSEAAKKLALRYILENIDYRKKCSYLQDIISMSRENDTWRKALATYFDTPYIAMPSKKFSKN